MPEELSRPSLAAKKSWGRVGGVEEGMKQGGVPSYPLALYIEELCLSRWLPVTGP